MITTLKNPETNYSLRAAVWQGQPTAGDLFWLRNIPVLPKTKWDYLLQFPYQGLATAILETLTMGDPDTNLFKSIVPKALDFDIPLRALDKNKFVLEVFHGPTGAFKDVAARSLAQFMEATRNDRPPLTIAVATSGDTGGAVASAFHNLPGFRVFIFYPDGKVSDLQEKQLTTLGGNIHAFKVDGSFDDCQAIVKELLSKQDELPFGVISTANSINIMRLLPQATYYAWAIAQLAQQGQDVWQNPVNIVVPSGNMGNVTAATIAQKMGLPIKTITIACNANDPVVRFLETGNYEPHSTITTPANAMDVGNPSNFPRLLTVYGSRDAMVAAGIRAQTISDEEIYKTIRNTYKTYGYLTCPHTAVGLAAANGLQGLTIICGTAHPAKFEQALLTAFDVQDRDQLPAKARELDYWLNRTTQPTTYLQKNNWHNEIITALV